MNVWSCRCTVMGGTVYFEELVGGIPYQITGTIVEHKKTDADFCFALETKYRLSCITFIGKRTATAVFTHTERFGLTDTLWGRFVNFTLFRHLFCRQADWALIMEDIKQDNRNLKKILEGRQCPV